MAAKAQAVPYSQAHSAPLMLLVGKSAALAQRAAGQIRAALQQQHPQLEIHDLAADQVAAGQLLTVASPSLFGEPRLLRITNCDRASTAFSSDLERALPLLDNQTYLQLHHSDPARGKQLLQLLRQTPGALEIDCAEPKTQAEKFTVLRQEAARLQATVEPAAQQQLLQAYGTDLAEMLAIMQQLATDVAGRITAAHVTALTAGRVETTAFAVVDAALAANAATALVLLRKALDAGAEPLLLLGALSTSVRNMARVFGRRESAAQLAKTLGLPPWQVEKAQRAAAKWGQLELARTVQLLAATDLALKGQARDPHYALEKLVLAVARRGR